MAFRLVEEAEADLIKIWINVALDIGNAPAADRLIDAINERFFFLAIPLHRPQPGGLRPGLRSHSVQGYVILYKVEDEEAVILHILPGWMDIPNLL